MNFNNIINLKCIIAPNNNEQMFCYIFDELDNWEYLDDFRSYNNNLLVALDGTGYYSSQAMALR